MFVAVFWGLWPGLLSAAAPRELPTAVSFNNAQQQLQLQPAAEHYLLKLPDKTLPVNLNNKLLVKTASRQTATDISRLHPAIEQIQQLALLQHTTWWLITVTTAQVIPVMQHLQQQPTVITVQPDLLQQRLPTSAGEVISTELTPAIAAQHLTNVRLAIIDDGFDLQQPSLQNLAIVLQYDADLRLTDASPKQRRDQHGNKVLATVLAAARENGAEPELILIRQVSSWTSDMVLAFSVARMMKADIVNSSWILPFLPEPLSDLLADWLQTASPYLVFAAGNHGQDACQHNALSNINGVIVVGAQQQHNVAAYSNYGPCVDFYAPTGIGTANTLKNTGFGGTSASAAYVSGWLVPLLAAGQHPSLLQMQQQFELLTKPSP